MGQLRWTESEQKVVFKGKRGDGLTEQRDGCGVGTPSTVLIPDLSICGTSSEKPPGPWNGRTHRSFSYTF